MKYKTAKVVGHQRSGSHYLARLLAINFFDLENYLPLYAGHSPGHAIHLRDKHCAVFYIYRNNFPTLCSMWKIRNRLGLKANSFSEFCNTELSDMCDTSLPVNCIRDTRYDKIEVHEADNYFKHIKMIPVDYLNKHKKMWLNKAGDNLMPIKYEDLINDFDKTMKSIAKFLGSDKKEFINEKTRVGWYDPNDDSKKFA